jgi:hypothetical protein
MVFPKIGMASRNFRRRRFARDGEAENHERRPVGGDGLPENPNGRPKIATVVLKIATALLKIRRRP